MTKLGKVTLAVVVACLWLAPGAHAGQRQTAALIASEVSQDTFGVIVGSKIGQAARVRVSAPCVGVGRDRWDCRTVTAGDKLICRAVLRVSFTRAAGGGWRWRAWGRSLDCDRRSR